MRNTGNVLLLLLLAGCQAEEEKMFRQVGAAHSGIDFTNSISTSVELNALTFEYIYNGSGVGVGDFNADGSPDLFFGGNQVSSRLYLNQGGLQFRDVTAEANLTTNSWVTGVSVVDINDDGLDDIYLSVSGFDSTRRENLFFINKGLNEKQVPVFEESAARMGINDKAYGTMAAFFDYDKDGDLDMYLCNNALEQFNRNNVRPKRIKGEAASTDKLYRNNGDLTFTDVSAEAGITIEGYGLGVVICDLNNDGWPDVYVANDFLSNDLIWVSNGPGEGGAISFSNKADLYLKHQTHNGMGVDIADFNNDSLEDIMVLDMLPPNDERRKLMISNTNYNRVQTALAAGYQPQFMKNTLQLNRGTFADGEPHFSEISYLSGVHQTDWSWAPLFSDFDNDGWKDLYIANGYRKDVTNLDFITYSLQGNKFGTYDAHIKRLYAEIDTLPEVKLPNYMFRNSGDLQFANVTEEWGLDIPSFSNGTVYVDLDQDGDLDIVTNNIDHEAFILENRLNSKDSIRGNFLKVKMAGNPVKYSTSKVFIYTAGGMQMQHFTPYRGYKSSVDPLLHFGLLAQQQADSVVVQWNTGGTSAYYNVPANSVLEISEANSKSVVEKPLKARLASRPWAHMNESAGLDFTHQANAPVDLKATPLLLHNLSVNGPVVAVGDVNGDGSDDFYVGGDRDVAGSLFISSTGTYRQTPMPGDSAFHDTAAVFFDADGDGDADLYVVSGGSHYEENSLFYSDRIYMNDGNGNFTKDEDMVPDVSVSGAVVVAFDYDVDGDMDLFIGGGLLPGKYPYSPQSYVLRNDGGQFIRITQETGLPGELGLISSAVSTDLNKDGRPDLIVAGEWMPVRVFLNTGTKFEEGTAAFGLENSHGWWNSLHAADLNNDGFPEIVAGNAGMNSFFKPTEEEPLEITAKDFDNTGSVDPILTYYNGGTKRIFHPRDQLIQQIVPMRKRFQRFTKYAKAGFAGSFTKEELRDAYVVKCNTLESVVLWNREGKMFNAIPLPPAAQFSKLRGIESADLNNDGYKDLILVGNSLSEETILGWYDASFGDVLINSASEDWKYLKPAETGFVVEGEAVGVHQLAFRGRKSFLVAQHNGPLLLYGQK